MVVNYYLVSLSFKFYADPCINKRTQVVNARMHVISRVRVYNSCWGGGPFLEGYSSGHDACPGMVTVLKMAIIKGIATVIGRMT